jgi:hypothetical protein
VEELTTVLTRAIALGGNSSGGSRGNYKRISTDLEKFLGTKKVISKHQQ